MSVTVDGTTWRVVAWTPYGRTRTVSILQAYLARDHAKGVVDEWVLYLNCEDPSDEAYAHDLADRYPWVTLLPRPDGIPQQTHVQRYTAYAIRAFTDPGTIYVRLDDDMTYLHEDAITNLVESKARLTGILGAFPMVVNNAVCSWFWQQTGVIPETHGTVQQPYCMDPVGWASGEFGVALHRQFLDVLEGPDPYEAVRQGWYLYQCMPLSRGQQFSVSFHAVSGADYCELDPPGHLDWDEEEHWLTVHRPPVVGKTNVLIGDSIGAHWTFKPQRHRPEHAAEFDTILARYRALAVRVEASL